MALSFCCGAECGVDGAGAAVPSGVYKHWHNFTAGVTNVTTTVRTGSRAWQISPSAASAYIERQPVASQNRLVGRAYVRWSTLPNSSCSIFYGYAGGYIGVAYNNSTGKITSHIGSTYASTGVTAATGQWYCIEFYANTSANPWTVDVRINGEAIAQQTSAVAANTFTYYGVGNGNATTTMTMFADDIAFLTGSADLSFFGGGEVYGLAPNADGTHSFDSGDFIWDAAGGSVPTNSTTSNSYVSGLLDTTIGNFLNAAVSEASSPDYIEWTLPDLPVSPTAVNGVEFVAAYHSAGTSANNIGMKMSDGTNVADIHGLIDVSESTILLPSFQKTTAPDGGAWAEADVNALRIRWGYTTDANPDIYLNGVRAEVDVSFAPTIALNTADAQSFSTTTPTVEFTGSDSDGDTLSYDVRIRTKTRDDYLEDNQDSFYAVGDPATRTAVGQSFHGWTGQLTYASFYLKTNAGSPSGNMTAKLYAHSGSFGSTSVPTGSALATSTAVNANTLTGSYAWTHFNFGSPYTLSSGTDYVIVVEFSQDASNTIAVGLDASSPSHAGNASTYLASWTSASQDLVFQVFSQSVTPVRISKTSVSDAGFANTVTPADTSPFNQGEKCDYDVQAGDALTSGVDYYWTARAYDRVTYSSWATERTFSVATGAADPPQTAIPLTTTLDQPTVAAEATPAEAALTTFVDQAMAGVGANPDTILAPAAFDQTTIATETVPAAFVPVAALDQPLVSVEATPDGYGATTTLDQVEVHPYDEALLESDSFLLLESASRVGLEGAGLIVREPDTIPVTVSLPAVTIDVEAAPAVAALTTTIDAVTVSIGATPADILVVATLDQAVAAEEGGADADVAPDAVACSAFVDQVTVDVEAAPDTASTTATLDVPTVGVETAPAAFQVTATPDQPTVDVEAAPATVAFTATADQATVAVETAPAALLLPGSLDQPAAAVEATPDTLALPASADQSTAAIGTLPDAFQVTATLEQVTVSVEATPAAFELVATLDQAVADGGGVSVERTPEPAILTAGLDQIAIDVEAKPTAIAVTCVIGFVDALNIAIPAVSVEATPSDVSLTAFVPQTVPDVGVAPATIEATTTLGSSTIDAEATPAAIGVTTGLDTPIIETAVPAAVDLEDGFDVLLEGGSRLLLQSGEWSANITPEPIPVVASVPLCRPTAAGYTISQPFAYEPYAFSGLATHIEVTPDAFAVGMHTVGQFDPPRMPSPQVEIGAVPDPVTPTIAADTPNVSISGIDGNANPSAFAVGMHTVGQFDPPRMPRPQVEIGAVPDPVTPTIAADTPTLPVDVEVTPDAFRVRVATASLALESGFLLLTEDGTVLGEETDERPTISTGAGDTNQIPTPIAVPVVIGDETVGLDVTPDVVMVLAELAAAQPQVLRVRRRPTRRAILVLRGTGKSRLVVRS